jgi:adenylate cyclase
LAVTLSVLENGKVAFEAELASPLEVGRQRSGEPGPYAMLPATATSARRLVLARQDEGNCSRQHLRLEPLPGGAVRIANGSQIPLSLAGTAVAVIPPGSAMDLTPPFSVLLPPRTLTVGTPDSADEHDIHALMEKTIRPGALKEFSTRLRLPPTLGAAQLEELADWLQMTVGVLQSSIGSPDFLDRAAVALVQIVGLDTGRVLLLAGDRWDVAAAHGAGQDAEDEWRPSKLVLDRVRDEKRTFWRYFSAQAFTSLASPSLTTLQGVVAAPLLDREDRVIGALYGERLRGGGPLAGSGRLEATLVELLAGSVSAGLARQEQERAAIQAQVCFEQFFGSDLARQVRENPHLLEGRETEVSLLFCDVRGFSGFSEKLGAAKTGEWIGDVMGALSECVLGQDGVLVDYIGDELIAMWGAPRVQADHAERAARAALAMLGAREELNRRWQAILGSPMDLGIGVNTGRAQVGNTGSRFKFKYGANGSTVNVASRVQGVTKYLKCRLLMTAATRRPLGADFVTRRVCKARLVNIVEPVDLHEVAAAGPEQAAFFRASEEALDLLEAREFARAARAAGELLLDHPDDGPLLLVLSRAATHLMPGAPPFDPVWEPPGK